MEYNTEIYYWWTKHSSCTQFGITLSGPGTCDYPEMHEYLASKGLTVKDVDWRVYVARDYEDARALYELTIDEYIAWRKDKVVSIPKPSITSYRNKLPVVMT